MCELTNGMGAAWVRHAMCESALSYASYAALMLRVVGHAQKTSLKKGDVQKYNSRNLQSLVEFPATSEKIKVITINIQLILSLRTTIK